MKFIKKIILLVFSIFLIIIVSTTQLLRIRVNRSSDVSKKRIYNQSVEDKIRFLSENLSNEYFTPSPDVDDTTFVFIQNINKHQQPENITSLWKLVNSWVSKKFIVNAAHTEVGKVVWALKNTPIVKADLDKRGSQLKFLLTLQGDQQVIFKPKWYDKQKILDGPVYGGKDRYNSEILAFHLSIILNMPFSPICTERLLSIKTEVLPVASMHFLETTINNENNTCIYGRCYYCSKQNPVCSDQSDILPGAVIFNIRSTFKLMKSPWRRTYKIGLKAIWEKDDSYCKFVKKSIVERRLLEMIDIAIFDFFIQNGDRHHYEVMKNKLLLIDNGKGLGNPYTHHVDILAPLYQCCMMRKKTWSKLLSLKGHKLSSYLTEIPDIRNIVMKDHLKAMDIRLMLIFAAVEYCKTEKTMTFI